MTKFMNVYETTTKLLGKPVVYVLEQDGEQRFAIRYKTRVFNKKSDIFFKNKLSELGFLIETTYFNTVEVIIPEEWKHLKIDKHREIIIDEKDRTRVIIDSKQKTTELIRRFNIEINMLVKRNAEGVIEENPRITVSILDCNKLIKTFDIELLSDHEIVNDASRLNELVEDIVDQLMPGWKDELMYWD
ncbi:MAG: hypothetical protein ACK4F9_06960 [Brevinematia bacterium]